MAERTAKRSRGLLDPIDRITEGLFGLIMVLTFTGSISAAEAGQATIREMLIGAIGCNLAWGVVDALMYLMACWTEHAREIRVLRRIHAAATPDDAHRAIANSLHPAVAEGMPRESLEEIRVRLLKRSSSPPRLRREDWLGALAVFLWVFLITFPVVVPFLFVSDPIRALRWSNAVAIALLFVAGEAFGRHTGSNRWAMGLLMVLGGVALVAMVMALGG
jgi:VIT1/CCC1 family predicted Fe2+/Mn2+ transporter